VVEVMAVVMVEVMGVAVAVMVVVLRHKFVPH
jgi:hypothetical protein